MVWRAPVLALVTLSGCTDPVLDGGPGRGRGTSAPRCLADAPRQPEDAPAPAWSTQSAFESGAEATCAARARWSFAIEGAGPAPARVAAQVWDLRKDAPSPVEAELALVDEGVGWAFGAEAELDGDCGPGTVVTFVGEASDGPLVPEITDSGSGWTVAVGFGLDWGVAIPGADAAAWFALDPTEGEAWGPWPMDRRDGEWVAEVRPDALALDLTDKVLAAAGCAGGEVVGARTQLVY